MHPILITLALLALLPRQDRSPLGSIRGTVTSESSGQPIANTTITLSHSSFVTHTDEKGAYRLTDIPPMFYDLTFSAPGYIPLVFREILIPPTTALGISVILHDSKGEEGKSFAIVVSPSPWSRPSIKDKMLIYQPDSTIDYKIRIIDPDSTLTVQRTIKKK